MNRPLRASITTLPRLSVRGGMGLGDAIYVQSVVRHFVKLGHAVEACSAWPEVFLPLGSAVTVTPFRRERIDRLAHYATRRGAAGTTQFDDCCINAGISGPVDLRLDWTIRNEELAARLKRENRPIIVVQMPRAPFGRSDGFGSEFLPDCRVIQRAIDRIKGRAFLVVVGKGDALYRFSGIDLDLTNKTSVSDLLDVGRAAGGFLGQCSFIIPIAESFGKPVLLVWSRRGLKSSELVIRQMTPKKILHRASSRAVIDDCSDAELNEACDAFLDQAGSSAAL